MRALAAVIGCDIHPLNNLAPLQYLKRELKQEQPAIDAWYHHWIHEGFSALETMIQPGPYCYGDTVTLADIYLVPQMYNARRLKVPLDKYPKLVAIDAALAAASGLRQGASGKPAGRGVTASPSRCCAATVLERVGAVLADAGRVRR